MQRGEVWTVAGGPGYAGKPRPAVIVQDDAFAQTASVTICLITSDPTEAPLFRVPLLPDATNGLNQPCTAMADKLTNVERSRLGQKVGRLSRDDLARTTLAMMTFLGAGS